ncbi:snare associated Golgi protein-domain-containing protein [Gamsiella multidivaricata]|uniref:snare associated Golgi protein-domain-containing protein n=1 Tax=Gamsiella multidivaricata TaxID=101098 RepID=UPI00221ED6FF|nr:snare associated Golgi protein-domain-containing protein [Gamsiella multidivaricata]KAG0365837.1 Transmembrane protein 41B [Gamsiella multidivaricata]KAI7820793.1 snare associated Golgi protein-domain-containing protein [Gamsiella multidivaricata]
MDEREEQRQPLLSGSQQQHASGSHSTAPTYASIAATGLTQESRVDADNEVDSSSDDNNTEITTKGVSGWRAWYRTILKFFQGLGKFFLILAIGTIILILVLQYTLPRVDEEQRKDLHFPHSLEDLEALRKILTVYMEKHYYRVMFGFLTVYLYLQTFSVPGSMWLSILGGALFKFWVALIMVSLASAVGATNCYLLSRLFFSKLVKRKFGDRMEKWNTQLQRHRNNLLSYIILLRLAPFPPNWFVNICSPHLNVPLWPEFFLGTLIGVAAPSVVHVQAGLVLEKLVEDHSSGVNIFTLKNIAMLGAVALLAALPVLIRWVLARYEARKVGLDVDALLAQQEEGEGGTGVDAGERDPILEPLDPTGVIISPENQHFLRRSSSSYLRTAHQYQDQHQQHPQ